VIVNGNVASDWMFSGPTELGGHVQAEVIDTQSVIGTSRKVLNE
jgi:hypothetical protein